MKDHFINIALPKGRLGEKVYGIFADAGYDCPEIQQSSRRLLFENTEKQVRYFWAKPSDVSIYVEHGVADVGVCGKDIILEYEPDVYELLDVKAGECKMAIAGRRDFSFDRSRPLRVATKFDNITDKYLKGKGIEYDVIHLNGSIELAPVLGLSDVILDIVETGNTLRENDLHVIEEVLQVSARLIANKASYEFKRKGISALVKALKAQTEEPDD